MSASIFSVGDATVLGRRVRTTDEYLYNPETFQYMGVSQLFDAGEKARNSNPKTFESIKAFIESKGEEPLIDQEV